MKTLQDIQKEFDEKADVGYGGDDRMIIGCYECGESINRDSIKSFFLKSFEEILEELNDCACKEKWTLGLVHRKDNPCYWPERKVD